MLCTSGFMDVMFSHNGGNGSESKMMCMFYPVRQVAEPAGRQTALFGQVRRWRHKRQSLPSPTDSSYMLYAIPVVQTTI